MAIKARNISNTIGIKDNISAKPNMPAEGSKREYNALSSISTTSSNVALSCYIILWYAFNVAFNIYNKKILKVFPFPWTVAVVELGIGLLYVLPVWGLGLRKRPHVDTAFIKSLTPIAMFHTIGHVASIIACSSGTVSFANIVKAAEPFFSTILSGMLTGVWPDWYVNMTLLPVIGGVIISAVSELNFAWASFISAMISNISFALRSIFSKKQMKSDLSPANLYAILTLISFIMLLPFSFIMEGKEVMNGLRIAIDQYENQGDQFFKEVMYCGFSYYLYNEVSYLALGSLTPVSHAVANTVKRIVVIVVSILFFGTTITMQGWMGSATAIGGVTLYSLAKNYAAKKIPIVEKKIQ